MHHHRRQHLVVTLHAAIPVVLIAAVRTVDAPRGERSGTVDRKQIVTVPIRVLLQRPGTLQRPEHPLEGRPQASRIDMVEALAQAGIRGSLPDAEQAPQVEADRALFIRMPIELQKRPVLQPEDRETRHHIVRHRNFRPDTPSTIRSKPARTFFERPGLLSVLRKTVPLFATNLPPPARFFQLYANDEQCPGCLSPNPRRALWPAPLQRQQGGRLQISPQKRLRVNESNHASCSIAPVYATTREPTGKRCPPPPPPKKKRSVQAR